MFYSALLIRGGMNMENMENVKTRKKTMIKNIKKNYRQVEKSIVEQLYMKQDLHGTTIGSEREDVWGQIFEMILPKKFVMEHSVFIIDSEGNVSREVDLAILDETYTPYIFRYGRLKFIPIEAVAAVVECKSQTIDPKSIKEWGEQIQNLKTSDVSIARMATRIATEPVPTQKATRPIRILCALSENLLAEKSSEITGFFDFTLIAVKETKKCCIEVKVNSLLGNLFDCYKSLNFHDFADEDFEKAMQHLRLGDKRKQLEEIYLTNYAVSENGIIISLLTFNFQLNQLLMLINNPMLFPHRAYVKMFNSEEGDGQ